MRHDGKLPIFERWMGTCGAGGLPMSALPPKADITTLFDHLVGNGEQVSWHLYAKRARRLEVDDEFEFG
jgi:hypothetical protein